MVSKAAYTVGWLLLTLALTSCVAMQEGPQDARIGQPAPGFELPDLQGTMVSLEDLRGKVVMLDFWATWCGPCRRSMPMLEELQSEYPEDLVLLAINLEEPLELVRSFVDANEIKSRVLLDEELEVGRVYQSISIPMQVIIDREGIVQHIEIGFTGGGTKERLRSQIEKLRAG
jgi:thiol-disulfide isomerase/thioredoxin